MYHAASYYKDSLRAATWLAWQRFVAKRQAKHKKYSQASEYRNKLLQQKCIDAWIVYWRKVYFCCFEEGNLGTKSKKADGEKN